jgi:hypothetical protein
VECHKDSSLKIDHQVNQVRCHLEWEECLLETEFLKEPLAKVEILEICLEKEIHLKVTQECPSVNDS